MLKCFCCGADITAPVFINKKPYGYTCARKIDKKIKKSSLVAINVTIEKNENGLAKVIFDNGRYLETVEALLPPIVDGKAYYPKEFIKNIGL